MTTKVDVHRQWIEAIADRMKYHGETKGEAIRHLCRYRPNLRNAYVAVENERRRSIIRSREGYGE